MSAIGRRKVLLGASMLALAACSGGLSSCSKGNAAGDSPDDMTIGSPDAPVQIIEYASSTCPHCAHFHETVWDQLKANYIDTGKVRFTFREYPTNPPALAVAGFQLARCGGATPEQYFNRVGELFRQQRAIFGSGSMEGVRAKFVEIGGAAGLSEEQVMQCITDESGAERIRRTVDSGNRQFDISGTPTFIIQGKKVEDPAVVTYEGISRIIDGEIAKKQ